jgi:predicted O-methyltransferase YrrM
MEEKLAALLDALAHEGRIRDAAESDRRERLRNLEPESARMLALLVRATRPASILELGTSNGYSTIWLADAARYCGASLVSVEIDARRSAQARANLERAELADAAELIVADAGELLGGTDAEARDLIFLDAERGEYAGYWADLARVLAPGGLLAIDNAISHADEVAELRALIAADERFFDALVPIGAGVLLAVKAAASG